MEACVRRVCGSVAGAVAVKLRSVSSFASCLAKEHLNHSKIVLVRRSSSPAISWPLFFGSTAIRKYDILTLTVLNFTRSNGRIVRYRDRI